jgi:hypothetical protein
LVECLEHLTLVLLFQSMLDDLFKFSRVIHQHKVANGRAFFFQQHWDLHRKEEHQRQHENTDPKTFSFRVLHIFAERYQKCIPHRKLASRASGPTSRTKTSCKVGSV